MRAGTTHTGLIDVDHRVTALFGMINVPSGVWIDERGRIVRPPEVAYSEQKRVGNIVAGDDEYVTALRDWVARGPDSAYAIPAAELADKMRPDNENRAVADAHFTMAAWLHRRGETSSATRHFRRAQDLDPDNWNYHRQEWTFLDPATRGDNFRKKRAGLGDRPYYAPADLRRRDR